MRSWLYQVVEAENNYAIDAVEWVFYRWQNSWYLFRFAFFYGGELISFQHLVLSRTAKQISRKFKFYLSDYNKCIIPLSHNQALFQS